MGKAIDLTGKKFGRLSVLRQVRPDFISPKNKSGFAWWRCRCECGAEVDVRSISLRRGDTKSCGCIQREVIRARNKRPPSRIIIGDDYASVELCDREGGVVDFALIDTDDVQKVKEYRWHRATNGYACSSSLPSSYLHRLILPNCDMVDHKNGEKLDCRKSNLRPCTPRQNAANSKARGGSSHFKGVTFHKRTGKWMAQISIKKRHFGLGYFASQEEAAKAYDEAAREHYGEFATCNFS